MTAIDTTSHEFLNFRDAHKDAYGFRADPAATTQEELVAEYNAICDAVCESIDEEKRQEDAAWAKFNATLDKVAASVGTRSNALRFLMDAEGCVTGHSTSYDLGFFGYLNGLSYTRESALKAILEG